MIEFSGGGNGLIFDSPDLFQKIVKNRIMFLELGADEGIEVVSIKVGFGSFGEVFHRSGSVIGADFATRVLDPNFERLQLLQPVLGNHDRDALHASGLPAE